MSLNILIIDYDAGNLRNVQKAFEHLGALPTISNRVEYFRDADALVLPGVGSFGQGMDILEQLKMVTELKMFVLDEKKPILGICLGMQLMAMEGYEGGRRAGLGLVPISVRKLDTSHGNLRLPHIGWNNVKAKRESILFADIPEDADFYFVHSYHAECEDKSIIAATCDYGTEFPAAVESGNVFATQFHPEKSQRYGIQLLKNFLVYCQTQRNRLD